MGSSLSWFAIRGKRPETVLQNFGLKSVGQEFCDTPFSGGPLPGGWFLVNHGRHECTNDEVGRLSVDCEVVACFIEEHVTVSRVACWKAGEMIWSVTHDAGEGDEHLEVLGQPPARFDTIRDRLTKQQENEGGADFIFSIPVELAREITGYSHEETSEVVFDNFVKQTFFQKLFRRS